MSVTDSPLARAADYTRHRTDRAKTLSGSNHAGQCTFVCRGCCQVVDVGYERLAHPTFRPYCWTCWNNQQEKK